VKNLPHSEIEAYVGKNIQFYKWASAAARGISWNWAAFLFAPLWMVYRKMYWQALAFMAVVFLSDAILHLTYGHAIDQNIAHLLATASQVVIGVMGNQIYRLHVQKQVIRFRQRYADSVDRETALRKAGRPKWSTVALYAIGCTATGYWLVTLGIVNR
jgi:hypothetical protein